MRKYKCPTCGYLISDENLGEKILRYEECPRCGTPFHMFKPEKSKLMTEIGEKKKKINTT